MRGLGVLSKTSLTLNKLQQRGTLLVAKDVLDNKLAMPSYLTISASIVVAYFSTFVYHLIRNLSYARKSGFPSVLVPWDQNHFIWIIISVPLRPYLEKWLPQWIYNRLVLCIYGNEFTENLRPFEQYLSADDKTFMLVTCGRPELSTRDPEIVVEILNRTRDFLPNDLTELFVSADNTTSWHINLLILTRWPSSAKTF